MVPLIDLLWPLLLAAAAAVLVGVALDRLLPRRTRVVRVQASVLAGIRDLAPLPGEHVLSLLDDAAPGSDSPAYRLEEIPSTSAARRWEGRTAYHLAVSIMVAYLAGLALVPGTDFAEVLRFATAAAFLGHGSVSMQGWLSEHRSWRSVAWPAGKAIACSLVTGSIFAALWPTT